MSFDPVTDAEKEEAALAAQQTVERYLGNTASEGFAQAFAGFVLAAVSGSYPPEDQENVRKAVVDIAAQLVETTNARLWKLQ